MTARSVTHLTVLAAAAIAAGACDNSLSTPSQECPPLQTAAASARVDLGVPSFSNPTAVNNPLFPVSSLHRVVLLGTSGGLPFHVETTLMPGTVTIELDTGPVEALTSQYVAWLDGKIHEVALDWYVQDDAGAVWYLGEDVFNYENGVIVDTDGTWLAGRDGPAAMIMAPNPAVGMVWRPENICGVVFEEVAVVAAGVTVNGPRGPVAGAIVIDELHMDGTHEDKTFAPGYGEFSTGSGANLEAVALAVPTDAIAGPVPAPLALLTAGADTVFDAAQTLDWTAAAATFGRMTTAWNTLQAGSVPPMIAARMSAAMAALGTAVQATSVATATQAAIDVAQSGLDLQLRHRPVAEVDVLLLALWARQLQRDAALGDRDAVVGDAASIKWIRERLVTDVSFEPLDQQLRAMRAAAEARNLAGAGAAAAAVRVALERRR